MRASVPPLESVGVRYWLHNYNSRVRVPGLRTRGSRPHLAGSTSPPFHRIQSSGDWLPPRRNATAKAECFREPSEIGTTFLWTRSEACTRHLYRFRKSRGRSSGLVHLAICRLCLSESAGDSGSYTCAGSSRPSDWCENPASYVTEASLPTYAWIENREASEMSPQPFQN